MKDNKIKNVNTRKGSKRATILLVLRALEQMSDEKHPIKQIHIAKMVNDIGSVLGLNIWCDRKTVGRHLRLLRATGYNIVTVKGKGSYIESNKFTKQESDEIIKMVNESKLPSENKEQLLKKLIVQQKTIDKDKLFFELSE